MSLPYDPNYVPPPPVLCAKPPNDTQGRGSPVESGSAKKGKASLCSTNAVIQAISTNKNHPPVAAGKTPSKRAAKRRKFDLDSSSDLPQGLDPSRTEEKDRVSQFIHLPLEILAEILLLTSSPKDLLSVARTCKALCAQLLSPGIAYVWKYKLKRAELPVPATVQCDHPWTPSNAIGIGPFIGREPAYAAFVFDGGVCENCGEETDSMYRSYSLRLRICSKNMCFENFKPGSSLRLEEYPYAALNETSHDLIWQSTPVLESCSLLESAYFFPHYNCWPSTRRVGRHNALETAANRLQLEEEPYDPGNGRYSLRKRASVPDSRKETRKLTEASQQRFDDALSRNCLWMKFCVALIQWQAKWLRELDGVGLDNKRMSFRLAKEEHWKYSDMMKHTMYKRLFELKTSDRQVIQTADHERLRPIIARELHDYYANKDRKIIMQIQKKNPNQIWKYYQKLMSQDELSILPPYPVFLSLPAVQMLQSRDLSSAKVSVKKAVSEKGFLKDLIKQQIRQWVKNARYEMLMTIDPSGALSKEWKTKAPTSADPHPVTRLDALWKCKACNSVDDRGSRECLDFVGVCQHLCKEKGGKKKRATASHPWNIDNFVRDEQGGAVMNSCMAKLLALRWEDHEHVVKTELWICKSCDPPLLVHSRSLIGHSHRHAQMADVEVVTPATDVRCYPARRTFVGLARWLIHKSKGLAKKWVEMKNFVCIHCLYVRLRAKQDETLLGDETQVSIGTSGPGTLDQILGSTDGLHVLNFNGLRAHLASKHEVYSVRDEDFYCLQDVKDFPDAPAERPNGLFV